MHGKTVRYVLLVTVLTLLLGSTAAMAQEVTIRVTGWSQWIGDMWIPEIEERLAEQGIRVEFEYITSGQYVDKVLTQTAGGVPPDLMQDLPYRYTLQQGGWNGIHRDLTPFLEADPEFRDSFVPAVWGLYEYFDGVWILPAVISPYLTFYNRDHFQEAGIDYPDGTWRWDAEVEEVSKRMRRVNDSGMVTRYGLLMENRLPTALFSNGGEVINADGTRSLLAERPVVDMMSMFQQWRQQDIIPALGDKRGPFETQQGSMQIVMGTFAMYRYATRTDLNWGVSEVPLGDAGRQIEENTWGFAIHRDSPNAEAAWIVAKELVKVHGGILMEGGGQFSVRIGEVTRPETLSVLESFGLTSAEIAIAASAINDIRPSFRHVRGAEITTIRNQALSNIMVNGEVPMNALLQAAEQIDRILAESAQ